jgi:peptidoglycan hydrolase CwlO-like protein
MSQFNETQQTTTVKKNNSIIYWVIILVLIAAVIFLFVSKNNQQQANDDLLKQRQQTIDSVKTDRATLQTDFDAASAKIDQLVSQNAKMDSALQGDKAEIASMQGRIKTILANKNATQAELKQAREMISGLTDKTKALEARIAELEKQNADLTGQNKQLSQTVDSTVKQNTALKTIGSVLHASNIRMEPIHDKKNGKEKETMKHRKVNDMRIKFDIDENRIAESGTKQLYLRLIAPDNTIMSSTANGSGMMTSSTGDQLSFSIEKDVALTQNMPVNDVVVDWHPDGEFKKGTYTIEIFNGGYKIGSGKVTLK